MLGSPILTGGNSNNIQSLSGLNVVRYTFPGITSSYTNNSLTGYADSIVILDGISLTEGVDYTLSGNTINFSVPVNGGQHLIVLLAVFQVSIRHTFNSSGNTYINNLLNGYANSVVYLDGIALILNVDYTIAGNTITFTSNYNSNQHLLILRVAS